MNRSEARAMANRIAGSWPTRWSEEYLDAWAEDLADLDVDVANATLRRLRRTEEQAPKIATFLAACRSTSRTAGDDGRPRCATCGGCTWIPSDATEEREYGPARRPVTYTFVDDCRCTHRRARTAA